MYIETTKGADIGATKDVFTTREAPETNNLIEKRSPLIKGTNAASAPIAFNSQKNRVKIKNEGRQSGLCIPLFILSFSIITNAWITCLMSETITHKLRTEENKHRETHIVIYSYMYDMILEYSKRP